MPKSNAKATTSVLQESLMQTSSQSNDPYFLFRDELGGRLKKLQALFENWEVLLRTENCETSATFKKANISLRKKLNAARKMANELTRSVSHVRENREMFPHISESELKTRQQFIDSAKQQLGNIRSTVRSPATQAKMDQDRQAVLAGGAAAGKAKAVSIQSNSTRDYIDYGNKEAQSMLAEQDKDFDQIDVALDEMHDAGREIYSEIDSQNELLQELNEDVKKTQTTMDKVNDSLQTMLNTKDGCQLGVVVGMAIVCVISVILLVTSFT